MDAALWATIIIGTLAILIAFIQMDIMRRQREIMDDQTDLMRKQTELAIRQDEIVLKQLAKQPALRLCCGQEQPELDKGRTIVHINIDNIGTKSAYHYLWNIWLEQIAGITINVVNATNNATYVPQTDTQPGFIHYGDHINRPIVANRFHSLCDIYLQGVKPGLLVRMMYLLSWEEGNYPTDKLPIMSITVGQPLPPLY